MAITLNENTSLVKINSLYFEILLVTTQRPVEFSAEIYIAILKQLVNYSFHVLESSSIS